MTDQYTKDLDKASQERAEAAEKAASDVQKADENFVKASDTADAKAMNRDPITGAPGSHPVGTGVGTTGGAIAGAAVGTLVAGPLGTAVGGVVGAIAGAAAGHSAGEAVNPTVEEVYWRDSYMGEPYYNANYAYNDYAPAYKLGYESRAKSGSQIWDEQQDMALRSEWESSRGTSRLDWNEARLASMAAWNRANHRVAS